MTSEMWIILAVRVLGSLPVLRWPLAGAFIAILADLSDLFLRDWIDLGGVKDYQRFDKWLDQVYMLTFLAVTLRWQELPRNIAAALYAFRLAGFVTFEISGERGVLIFFPNVFEYWFIFVAALKTFGSEKPGAGGQEPAEAGHGGSGSRPAQRAQPGDAPQAQRGPAREPQLSLTRSPETPTGPTPETDLSLTPSDLRPPPSYLIPPTSYRNWPMIGAFMRFAIPYRYSRPQLAVAGAVILAAKLFHEYTLHVGQWFEGFTATEALEAIWRFLTPPY